MTGPSRAPLRLTEIAAPLVLLGVLGGGTLVMTVTWLATWVAASLSAAWTVPGWGSATVSAMAEATRLASLDPLIGAHGSRGLFWTAIGVQTAPLFAVAAAVTWWVSARGQYGTAARSLARRRDVADMVGRGAQRRAMQLRPSLQPPAARRAAGRRPRLDPRDMGMRLGRLGRHDVYASEEDVVLEIAGPRSNKTSALVVPAVLSAVGPVVTTSNKVDVYTLTVGLRAQVGRVFVMDPQRICGAEQTWWWNALAGINDMADAQYLVTHFSQTVGAGHERADPYFTKGAERLIGQLFVAASHSGATLRDVLDWLATRSEEPVGLLRRAGLHAVARGLQGTIEAPPDQRGGLYETALTALGCLESEAVLRYVTPPSTWLTPPRVNPIERSRVRPVAVPRRLPDPRRDPAALRHPLPAHPRRRRHRRPGGRRPGRPPAAHRRRRPPPPAAAASTHRSAPSSTRPRTSARSATCPTCTPTSGRCRSRR